MEWSLAIKNDVDTSSQSLGEVQAVEVIEEALQADKGGELKEIELINVNLKITEGLAGVLGNIECGVMFDTAITYSLGGSTSGVYTHNWEVLLECDKDIPQSLSVDAGYEGFFDGTNIDRTVEGTRSWVWTDLDPSCSIRTLNGTTFREGNRTSSIGLQRAYQWILNTAFIEVEVDKETDIVLSGLVNLNGSLSNSNGNSYTFEGILIFNGDGTATLTINGNIYEIELD